MMIERMLCSAWIGVKYFPIDIPDNRVYCMIGWHLDSLFLGVEKGSDEI